MVRRSVIATTLWIGLLGLVGGAVCAQAQVADSLESLRFDIVGVRLAVDPPVLTVPKDIPTFINTELVLPEGAGPEAEAVIRELADGAAVLAELRGPELAPTTVTALPGEPLNLPPFHLAGDYFLDNIRLVKDGEVVLFGTPSSVPIAVIAEILISSVTTRELTLDEIRERGIVLDESNFRAVEFQAAFVIDGSPVKIDFPVLVPKPLRQDVPGTEGPPQVSSIGEFIRSVQEPAQIIQLPDFDRPGLNLYLIGAEFVPVEPDGGEPPRLGIPPIPALLLIPGNIAFLNQFFTAIVMVQNGAPLGSGLDVREVKARIRLPDGLDQVPGSQQAPGDDPLRMAVTAEGVQTEIGIRQLGPDGERGTSDDVDTLRPGEAGEGEFLIEGLREGTHVFDIDLEAVLLGLPSGPTRLEGFTFGTVQVRNATFGLTLGQPRQVAVDEEYDLFATVTNTSERTVNLVSVTLDELAVSGAELLSDETVVFDTLAPGESAIATFRLRSELTGQVTFTQITAEPGVTANFTLRAGVLERGVQISPNALVLPSQAAILPDDLIRRSQRVLGQAYSVATAPLLPPGVRYIPRRTVLQRGRELTEISIYPPFALPLLRGLHEFVPDWLGNDLGDPGFEQLLRTTEAGDQWADAVAALLGDELATTDALTIQRDFAETLVYRPGHLSAMIGDGAAAAPAHLRLTNALDQSFERQSDPEAPRDRDLPFSQSFLLRADAAGRVELGVVARLLSSSYTIEVLGGGSGTTDLGVVVPRADGELLVARFVGLATAIGSRFTLEVDLASPDTLVLRIDADGDGIFEATSLPTSTEVLVDRAPEVLGVRSMNDFREIGFRFNLFPAHFGQLVDVLFNKSVDPNSVEDVSHWSVEANEVDSVALQPTGRLATLRLRKPIGALIPRELMVDGVEDERGNPSLAQTLPITNLLSDGAKLIGQVTRSDGRPVPGAIIQLSAFYSRAFFPGIYPVSQIEADEGGYFDFDFMRKTDSPLFAVRAIDPESGEDARVQSRVRFVGETEIANPIFFGRGRVVGRVFKPDGVTPAGTAAVNLFPDFYLTGEQGRGVYADAEGRFAIEDVPVGRFTLSVEVVEFKPDPFDGEIKPFETGEFATVTDAVRVEGETVEVNVVTTTRVEVGFGGVVGQVFLSDGDTPAVDIPIFLGSVASDRRSFSPIAETRSDASGGFEFPSVRPGGITAIALDPATFRIATGEVLVRSDEISGVNLVFGTTGIVSGVVRDFSGNLVPGALVSGGFELITAGADGSFTIPEIPIGDQTIAAGDPVTQKTGSRRVTVFPGETTFTEIRLQPAADITGTVRDTLGNPVAGADVRIPVTGAGYFKAESDNDGIFVFPNHGLGDFTVSAQGGGGGAPLSPDEVAAKLRDDFGDAARSRSINAIRAAFKQALEVFVGTSDLGQPLDADVTPGSWGFTRITSGIDGVAAIADIDYIPVGRVAGITIDGNALPTRASMQFKGLKLDKFGSPVFDNLGFFSSDTVTGEFFAGFAPHSGFLVLAARPFSPVILNYSGVLSSTAPNDEDIVMQFPPAEETNGIITGRVFEADGITPAGGGIDVEINVGDPPLTPQTDPNGFFDSQVPLIPRVYSVTAVRPQTGETGRSQVSLKAGMTSFVPVRLLGRTSVVVRVLRPDGSIVPGASVAVASSGFPTQSAGGISDAEGRVAISSLTEGHFSVLATEGDELVGRVGFQVTQEDALAGRKISVDVELRGFGTITGIFLSADGLTPIPNAQISLKVAGIAVISRIGPAAALTSTGADGRFLYDRVPVGDFEILAIDPTNLRPAETRGRLEAQGDTIDVTLVTLGLGRVDGVVLSADGLAAIPGAWVRLQPTRYPVASDALPPITASADGSFSFDGVPEGPFTVTAHDPISGHLGRAEGELVGEADVADVVVSIAGFGTISGQVVLPDGVTPFANADVQLAGRDFTFARQTGVDGDGRFRLEFLPLQAFDVTIRSRVPGQELNGNEFRTFGDPNDPQEIRLVDHLEEIDLTLPLNGLGTLEVTVVDANGQPVGLANVRIRADGPLAGTFDTGTDAGGFVAVDSVPVGKFGVLADSPNLRVAGAVEGEITTPGETVAVTVELGEAGSIVGRLVLPDGLTPVPAAFVTLRFDAMVGTSLLQVLTEPNGVFAFDDIPVGDFRVEVFEPISRGRRNLDDQIGFQDELVDLGDVVLDLDAPFIVNSDPNQDAFGVSVTPLIALAFNEPIDPTTVGFDNSGSPFTNGGNVSLVSASGEKLRATVAVTTGDTILEITPDTELESETGYLVTVDNGDPGIRDAAADRPLQDPFQLAFTTIDSIPPVVDSLSPLPDELGVPADAVIRIAFNEAMRTDWVLELFAGATPVPGSVTAILGGTVAVFTPDAPLALNASYTYQLSNAADLAGNPLVGGDLTISFTTLDTQGPAIDSIDALTPPTAGTLASFQAVVSAPDAVSVEFSVDDVPVLFDDQPPYELSTALALGAVQVSIRAVATDSLGNRGPPSEVDFAIAAIAPPVVTLNALGPTTVGAGGEVDFAIGGSGDLPIAQFLFSAVGDVSQSNAITPLIDPNAPTLATAFATLDVPQSAPSNGVVTVQVVAVDAAGQTSNAATVFVTIEDQRVPDVAISSPVDGAQILPGGAVAVQVDASDDVALALVRLDCSPAIAGCGEARNLSPPVAATTQVFDLVVPAGAEAPFEVVLTASATDSSGNPKSGVQRTLSLVDLVAPQLLGLTPLSGSTQVVQGQSVSVRAEASDNVGVAAISFDVDEVPALGQTVLVPGAPTDALVDFAFVVPPVADGSTLTIRAQAQDALANPSTVQTLVLTVGDVLPPDVTLSSPAEGASFVPGDTIDLVARATDDVGVARVDYATTGVLATVGSEVFDPAVTVADASFAVAIPIGTAPGAIRIDVTAFDAAGTPSPIAMRNVVVADAVAPVVNITLPAAGALVDPNQGLTVTVEASDNVAVAEISFGSETRIIDPATSPAIESFDLSFDPLPETQQQLTLNASALDTSGNAAAAPGVTVTLLDVVRPRVIDVTPVDGASGVDDASVVVIRFSEPVDPASVTPTSAALSSGGGDLPATAGLSEGDLLLTLTPNAPLPLFSTIDVVVTADVLDVGGNPLVPFASTFTTESADVLGPRVLGITPNDGATGVSISTVIDVQFDEPIDANTIDATSFAVTIAALPVSGTREILSGGSLVRFVPDADLPFGTEIETALSDAITDPFANALTQADGTPLPGPLVFSFTTGEFAIAQPRDGSSVVEKAELSIEAQAGAGLGVASVVFTINGIEQAPVVGSPFILPFTTPAAEDTPLLVIDASARDAGDVEIASDTVTVAVVKGLQVEPRLLGVPVGETRDLTLRLSSPLPGDLTVDLEAIDPAVVGLPASPVILPGGSTELAVSVAGSATGNTAVVASSALGDAGASVFVSVPDPNQARFADAPGAIGLFVPRLPTAGTLILPEASAATVSIQLLSTPAAADTPVQVFSPDPAIASVAVPVVIPAGALSVTLDLTTGIAGVTIVVLRAGDDGRELQVVVGTPPPGLLPLVVAPPVGVALVGFASAGNVIVPPGTSPTVTVTVLFDPAPADTPLEIVSTDPTVADVVGAVVISAGSRTATFTITTGAEGVAELLLRAGDEGRALTVVVGTPPPNLLPAAVAQGVGLVIPGFPSAGQAIVQPGDFPTVSVLLLAEPAPADTVVAISSSDPNVADVLVPVIIPSGSRLAAVPITPFSEGTTELTLRAGDEGALLTVIVGTPPAGSLPLVVARPVGVALIGFASAGNVIVPPGTSPTVTVAVLFDPAPADTPLEIVSTDPTVANVVGAVVISAGSRTATFTITTGVEGVAELLLRAGDEGRALTVVVGTPPPNLLPAAVAPPVGLRVRVAGSAGTLFLSPNAAKTVDVRLLSAPVGVPTDVTAQSDDPGIASVAPAALQIPAGSRDATLTVTAGPTDGETLIRLAVGAELFSVRVVVGVPPPGEAPPTVSAPVCIEVDVNDPTLGCVPNTP